MNKFIKLTLADNIFFDQEERAWKNYGHYPETTYLIKDMINEVKSNPIQNGYYTEEFMRGYTSVEHAATRVYLVSMGGQRHFILVLESPEYIMSELNKGKL